MAETACCVDMSMFWSGTYVAEEGDLIEATVSAWNIKGQGSTSEVGGLQKVEHLPGIMECPCGTRD